MSYSSLSCNELVRACAESGSAEAWQEFVCRFEKHITLVIWRVARRYGEGGLAVVEDLVQDTYAKICADDCRFLRNFKPQHEDAFFGMLKVTAANVARDYFRARHSWKRGSGKADSELNEMEDLTPDPNSAGPAYLERRILLQQIDCILSDICGGRDRGSSNCDDDHYVCPPVNQSNKSCETRVFDVLNDDLLADTKTRTFYYVTGAFKANWTSIE